MVATEFIIMIVATAIFLALGAIASLTLPVFWGPGKEDRR